jgi:hypothetical protein
MGLAIVPAPPSGPPKPTADAVPSTGHALRLLRNATSWYDLLVAKVAPGCKPTERIRGGSRGSAARI